MSFEDQAFIVTGGASGMGRATATLLAAKGANVVIADIDTEAGARVAKAIGDRAVLTETDLRSLDSIRSCVAQTEERFGQINGLANVAAVYPFVTFLDTTPEQWEQMEKVNLRGSFFMAQAVAQSMIRTGTEGAIVNVASGAAYRPVPGQAAYTATKGGVTAMTRTLAAELAPNRIRVNVMAPGHTASETARRHMTEEQLAEMGATLFGGRFMEPEEPAAVIVFLLSDTSHMMTGAAINTNQGNFMPH
jgi:NAD(P)-dependent dehydrogenase (short-subunit alcohol dehydrogenase family)